MEYKPDAERIKQALIDLLKDMPVQLLQVAYVYAKNFIDYGQDVTQTWDTAVENSTALQQAYSKGYYEGYCNALDKLNQERLDDFDRIIEELERRGGYDEKAFCKDMHESYKLGLREAIQVIYKYKNTE